MTAIRDLVSARRGLIEKPLVDFLGREVEGEDLQEVDRVLRDLGSEVRALDNEPGRDLGHADEPVEQHTDSVQRRQVSQLGGHDLHPRFAIAAHPHGQQLKRLAFALTLLALVVHAAATYARRAVSA